MSPQNNQNQAGLAAVLSFIFNGLGQLYNGQILKGLLIILLSAVSMLVLIIGSILIGLWLLGKIVTFGALVWGLAFFSIGLILICVVGIYSILDAYRVATKK